LTFKQTSLLPTQRPALIAQLAKPIDYDMAIVGGGATGLGIALDAALRGFSVVLVDSHDFAKGTSSRATKLLHGGVRYLAQGNISLVREALHERTTLLHNAPHLAQPLAFVMPSYQWWERSFYGAGLMLYDLLAGEAGLGTTQFLNPQQTRICLPTVRTQGLRGAVKYWDGQFDDARLALVLARTAAIHGALLVNYCRAVGLRYSAGRVSGLDLIDSESGRPIAVKAKCVINATGVWVDELRQIDGANRLNTNNRAVKPMVAPSQGIHIVVERQFLQSDHALIVPKTADGRVLFAVPWLGKVILGTTDTPREDLAREPLAFKEEVEFILSESARYLTIGPTRRDIKSIWVGLRPLVKPIDDAATKTKQLSREHTIVVSTNGLLTVTGGKWTTYRAMAEDVMQRCFDEGLLKPKWATAQQSTANVQLVGANGNTTGALISAAPGMHAYGSEQDTVLSLPGAQQMLAPGLTEAMVRFAVRFEYARTVEDVLARRSRWLFLDAGLAGQLAEPVAAIMRDEGIDDPKIEVFCELAKQYQYTD
jgi:glycerol-3-phosphate dehydrogenase